jgi:hypothetical protein
VAEGRFGKAAIAFKSTLNAIDHDVIELAEQMAESSDSQVVMDVSTMPKRFFFPLLTRLCESSHIQTLIVTNTTPEEYGKELARDADEWRPLPIYCGDSLDESPEATLMIGVGYHPFRIQEILERSRGRRFGIKLFLPFPSLHPGNMENWKFIRGITSEWNRVDAPIPIVRVPTHDASLAFDALRQHSSSGRTRALILAPFGPKPLSLAMCLLGIARTAIGSQTEIGYTQPRVYAPDYSIGIATQDGIPKVAAYCDKLNGRSLYAID